jgi:hypothetical protein
MAIIDLIEASTGPLADFKMPICIELVVRRGLSNMLRFDIETLEILVSRYKEHVSFWQIDPNVTWSELQGLARVLGMGPNEISSIYEKAIPNYWSQFRLSFLAVLDDPEGRQWFINSLIQSLTENLTKAGIQFGGLHIADFTSTFWISDLESRGTNGSPTELHRWITRCSGEVVKAAKLKIAALEPNGVVAEIGRDAAKVSYGLGVNLRVSKWLTGSA